MIKKTDKKLTINNQWYIDLDNFIDVSSCPDVEDMIINSYDYLRHTCSIRTFDITGKQVLDTWYCSNKNYSMENNSKIFEAEIKNKARSPYWMLALREGGHKSYIYDSLETEDSVWESIKWRRELTNLWHPFINWVESLPIKRLGHVSFFLNKPETVPHYHVDSGQDLNLENWVPKPHREEFIWLNFSRDKSVYVMDNTATPIRIKSHSAFFNTNNFHGSHESSHSWSYSVRIECAFSDQFRKELGIDHIERYYYE